MQFGVFRQAKYILKQFDLHFILKIEMLTSMRYSFLLLAFFVIKNVKLTTKPGSSYGCHSHYDLEAKAWNCKYKLHYTGLDNSNWTKLCFPCVEWFSCPRNLPSRTVALQFKHFYLFVMVVHDNLLIETFQKVPQPDTVRMFDVKTQNYMYFKLITEMIPLDLFVRRQLLSGN